MTQYEAEIEIPMNSRDLDGFVEALRAYGHPKIVVRFETSEDSPTKKVLAADVADALSSHWSYSGIYERDWWISQMKAIRGRKANHA